MIKNIFQDHEGNLSSTRIVWAISVLLIVITWSYVCIKNGQLHSFTTGDALWIATLFGGKVGQSFVERKFPKDKKNDIQVSVE